MMSHSIASLFMNCALCKFRTSSHDFRIETGRHSKIKLPIENRLCTECNVIEDEKHFVLKCSLNISERIDLYTKVSRIYPDFDKMTDDDKFTLLLTATWVDGGWGQKTYSID